MFGLVWLLLLLLLLSLVWFGGDEQVVGQVEEHQLREGGEDVQHLKIKVI